MVECVVSGATKQGVRLELKPCQGKTIVWCLSGWGNVGNAVCPLVKTAHGSKN